jgi:polyisoprenoid-binding protein YceI
VNTRRIVPLALPLFALLLSIPAAAGDETRFAIEDDQVFVGYQVALGRKQLSGVSHALAGSVIAAPEEGQVRLRVPVASFESGLPAVDGALREALEAERFPAVEFEGRAAAVSGDEATLKFEGTLRLHGQERQVSIPVQVARDGKVAVVHFTFFISLDAYGVKHPQLAGVAVGDKVQVDVLARLHAQVPGTRVAAQF